jgi:DNA anti-recombination protein RmuC
MSDAKIDDDVLTESLEARLEGIEKRLSDLRDHVGRSAVAIKDRVRPFLDELQRSRDGLSRALKEIATSAGDRGRDLARRARTEIEGLEHEVSAATEELSGELAESRTAFRDAASKELEAWRARLDHLAVQADLGRMEARDEIEALRQRAERAYSDAKGRIEEISEGSEEKVDVVRSGAKRVLDDVRHTVRDLRSRR